MSSIPFSVIWKYVSDSGDTANQLLEAWASMFSPKMQCVRETREGIPRSYEDASLTQSLNTSRDIGRCHVPPLYPDDHHAAGRGHMVWHISHGDQFDFTGFVGSSSQRTHAGLFPSRSCRSRNSAGTNTSHWLSCPWGHKDHTTRRESEYTSSYYSKPQ